MLSCSSGGWTNANVGMCMSLCVCAWCWLQNDTRVALIAFEVASKKLHNGRRNHAPLLAQAAVHFNSGNMAKAHQL
jgi:hypothetical protein